MDDFQTINTSSLQSKNSFQKESHWRDWVFAAITIFFLGSSYVHVRAGDLLVDVKKDITKSFALMEGGDVVIPPPPPPPGPVMVEGAVSAPTSTISSEIVLVQDVVSSKILHERDSVELWPMASITKLMSALALIEEGVDLFATSTAIGIDVYDTLVFEHEVYTNSDLFQAMLVGSSNRSVMTLASSTGGISELVQTMNKLSKQYGMMDTHFIEVTGLNRKNVSTAQDVSKLLTMALEVPEIVEALSKRDFTISTVDGEYERHMWNTDWLVLGWIPHTLEHIVGGKTGHILDSGFNFAMEVADEENNRIHVIVFGSDSHQTRFEEARDLAQWAFENYTWPSKENISTTTLE